MNSLKPVYHSENLFDVLKFFDNYKFILLFLVDERQRN